MLSSLERSINYTNEAKELICKFLPLGWCRLGFAIKAKCINRCAR